MPIVYMDEVVFSKRGFPNRAYSNKGVNITVRQSDVYSGFRTVIAAVNSDMGLILTDSKEIVTNEERILEFIPKLSVCMGGEPFAMFMDNLICHKTKPVQKLYEQFQIQPIWNIADNPDLNAIEICFSAVKLCYKQLWLNALANNREFDKDEAIDVAFTKITPELVKHSA